MSAQRRASVKSVLFWGGTGYSSILSNADDLKSGGGVGYEFGVGYEWSKKNFMVHAGVELQGINGVLKKDDFVHTLALVDDDWMAPGGGEAYIGKFYFSEIKDRNHIGYVNIPLMLGFNYNGFYFLAGGKVGVNVYGGNTAKNSVKIAGDYEEHPDEVEDVPIHGFGTTSEKNKYSVKTALNYGLSLEMGMNLRLAPDKNSKWRYRVGLFADYGLANLNTKSYSEELLINRGTGINSQPALNSLLRTKDYKNTAFNSLFVGVKFTMILGLKEQADCRCSWE